MAVVFVKDLQGGGQNKNKFVGGVKVYRNIQGIPPESMPTFLQLFNDYICLTTTQITFLNQFFETLLSVVKGSVVSESLFPTSSPKVTVMEFVHHYMLIARTGR